MDRRDGNLLFQTVYHLLIIELDRGGGGKGESSIEGVNE